MQQTDKTESKNQEKRQKSRKASPSRTINSSHLVGGGKGGGRSQKGSSDGDLHGQHVGNCCEITSTAGNRMHTAVTYRHPEIEALDRGIWGSEMQPRLNFGRTYETCAPRIEIFMTAKCVVHGRRTVLQDGKLPGSASHRDDAAGFDVQRWRMNGMVHGVSRNARTRVFLPRSGWKR